MTKRKTPYYAVLRAPCLMEDEGRYHLIGVVNSLERAKDAINEEIQESNGYYKGSDYQIYKEV